jgi:glycosyltransferase involved in cell wall biosynthesis
VRMRGLYRRQAAERRFNSLVATQHPRRHICIVTETYPPEINGVSLTLGHLAQGLSSRGHLVSMVRPWQQICDRHVRFENVTLVTGLPLPKYKDLQFGVPAAGLMTNLWNHRRPDVVYVATEGPLGWSAVRAARRLAIPVFSGFHTNYHSYSRHYGLGFIEKLVLGYLRHFHNRTQGTFVPTADLRDRLRTLGFQNVSCLARGVDSERFDPAKRSRDLRRRWGICDDGLAFLYVGRIASEKNIALAIETYRALKRTKGSARLVIVGDGPLGRSLRAENRDLIFVGMQTGDLLATSYASADVFLFPSQTETFGNVTLEAMASGLAVVAFDYAAAKCHIRNCESGMLAPLANANAFVNCAKALARDPRMLTSIRHKAREYATSISWSRIVEQFEALLLGDSLSGPETAAFSGKPAWAAAEGGGGR